MNLLALLRNKTTRLENGPYCKIPTEKEPTRALGFAQDWLCHITIKDTFHIGGQTVFVQHSGFLLTGEDGSCITL